MAVQFHSAESEVLGLRHCPRCPAVGAIKLDLLSDRGFAVVYWTDIDGEKWRDTGVKASDLASPDFGCGYCGGGQ